MFLHTLAMAAPAAAEGGEAAGGGILQFMPIIFMVAIFYFVLIRPQKRREKERKALIASVKSGQRVLLTGGILGEVTNVQDKTLIIRIADQTQIEVIKSAVSQVMEDGELPADLKA